MGTERKVERRRYAPNQRNTGNARGNMRWMEGQTRQQQQQQQQKSFFPSLGTSGRQFKQNNRTKPTLIVVYLGGITYAEIGALRFLSKRDSFPYHIIMVTTRVLNGTKLLQHTG
mmetsp:Transcript_30252/g.63316  ORF Transcript_30252/g.63316 Transcript_30252/m.63316 type:complete len:114 (+) Transcript_30252:106-447(+)